MDRNESQLVLYDIPIFLWLFGLIFAVVGYLILTDGQVPVMGYVFIGIGLALIVFPSVLKITADMISRTLKLDYRSVVAHKTKEMLFDQIAGIDLQRNISHRKGGVSYTYKIVIKKKDGEIVALHPYSSSGFRRKEKRASVLRDYIGVPKFDTSPAASFHEGLAQQSDILRETDGVRWRIQKMETSGSVGGRWHSPDFKTPGVFLLLAQKAEGQASNGFLASLGSMMFLKTVSLFGFQPDDTPDLERAAAMSPLDPALEPHFMAFTNNPTSACQRLNQETVRRIADWASNYPLKQFKQGNQSQLVVLFGPNGVYLAVMSFLKPEQVDRLSGLGLQLVKSQLKGNVGGFGVA